jgi:hypothetical protein
MADAVVPPIESAGVAGPQTSHQPGEWYLAGLEGQVDMVGHENPSEAAKPEFWNQPSESLGEVLVVFPVGEHTAPLDPPEH